MRDDGTSTRARCGACHVELLPDSSFCHACGKPLPAPLGPQAAGGERKPITVLFIDAFGSIGLGDRLDAEQWHDIVESFFSVVSIGVQRFGGTIDRLTGEGIKVLFGAPAALENHAAQACHAALHIAGRLGDFAASFRARAGVEFSVRMGLASGEAVFGQVGSGDASAFTSQGHTAALAARMQQLAEPGRIYLTEHTATLVADYFELRAMGEVSVRNANRPVQVYELTGAREHRSRLDAARERGLSPFVGRATELDELARVLHLAGDGRTRIVGIAGEPGIGKSRLTLEFVERQRERGASVQVVRCAEHARWIPFQAVLPHLRESFGIEDGDEAATARAKVSRTLAAVEPELLQSLPIVLTVLGFAEPDESARATVASAPTRDLARVVRRLLERDDERPVIYVIDDHHWMDAGSDAVLGDLLADPPRSASLVLITYRTGHRRRWMRNPEFAEIALRPLDRGETLDLVRSLIGSHASLGDLPERIVARAAGNPFFVEEIVRTLIDCDAIGGEPGAYRLRRHDVEVVVPGTLHGVLAARVDQLGEQEKSVLQAAAVVGPEFQVDLLAAVLSMPPEQLAPIVRALEGADFLRGFAWGDQAVYAFRHPLLRETVYRSLLGERRRQVHAAVMRELCGRQAADPAAHAARVARHAEAAGDLVEAARWYRRAARRTPGWDVSRALEHWRQVLACTVQRAPGAEREVASMRLAACEAVARFGFHLALPASETAAVLDEGDRLAAELGDAHMAARLMSNRGTIAAGAHDLAGARRAYELSLAEAERLGDLDLVLMFTARLVLSERVAGELASARRRADEVLERIGPGENPTPVARFHLELTRIAVLLDQGELALGASELTRVLHELRSANAPSELAWGLASTLLLIRHSGEDSPQLVGRVEEARALMQSLGVPSLALFANVALAGVRVCQQRWDEARELAGEARDAGIDLGHPFYLDQDPDLVLCYAALACGERDAALARARAALEAALTRGSALGAIDGLLAYGRILARDEGDDARREGRRLLQHGLALVRRTGARSRAPLFWLELAGVARRRGHKVGGRARQRRALRQLIALNAVGYVRRAAELLAGPLST